MPEYEAWCDSVSTAGWKIKYYKGLGTSTEEEAQEYFADIDRHRKSFVWSGTQSRPLICKSYSTIEQELSCYFRFKLASSVCMTQLWWTATVSVLLQSKVYRGKRCREP